MGRMMCWACLDVGFVFHSFMRYNCSTINGIYLKYKFDKVLPMYTLTKYHHSQDSKYTHLPKDSMCLLVISLICSPVLRQPLICCHYSLHFLEFSTHGIIQYVFLFVLPLSLSVIILNSLRFLPCALPVISLHVSSFSTHSRTSTDLQHDLGLSFLGCSVLLFSFL